MSRVKVLAALLFVLPCMLAPLSLALPDDRSQPVRITADSATRDDIAGVTRYEGSVELTQGSLHIYADSISVNHDEAQASVIVAEGSPARMTQTPAPDEAPVLASASRIEYMRSEDTVRFINAARVEQAGATVSGETIDYLISEQRVLASAGNQEGGRRVEVIIPPESLEREN